MKVGRGLGGWLAIVLAIRIDGERSGQRAERGRICILELRTSVGGMELRRRILALRSIVVGVGAGLALGGGEALLDETATGRGRKIAVVVGGLGIAEPEGYGASSTSAGRWDDRTGGRGRLVGDGGIVADGRS